MKFKWVVRILPGILYLIQALPLLILMTGFIFFVNWLTKKQNATDREIFKHWKYTVGQVIKTGNRKSGDYADVVFHVKGKRYVEEYGFRNPVLGNCYTIYYDSIDPGRMSVLNRAEQRVLVNIHNIEVEVQNVKIDSDTTPMGWHLIEYEYRFDKHTYSGIKYIKHKYYKEINTDSLLCSVNTYLPGPSYLIWPVGPQLYCIRENGILKLYLEGLKD